MDFSLLTALITPFHEDLSVDLSALRDVVDYQISNKAKGIVLLGTTGERMSLSLDEEVLIMKTVLNQVSSQIPVFVGAGCNCTSKSLKRVKLARELGADGVLAIVPYYNRPPFRGIIQHFELLAKVDIPVIVYHHPKRTGVSLSVDELAKLSQIEGVVAIKEASSNVSFAEKLIRAVSVPILCGDDALTLEMIKKGAKGTISVVSNIIPNQWDQMVSACLEEDWEKASGFNDVCKPLVQAIGREMNPIGIKCALNTLDLCNAYVRLPLCEALDENKKFIREALLFLQHNSPSI